MDDRPILAIVEPAAEASAALDRAAWLASETGAPIEVLACAYKRYTKADGRINSVVMNSDRARWREIADGLSADVPINVTVRRAESVDDGVKRQLLQETPAFVVKERDPQSLEWTLFTSEDRKLIEHCPAPLMLVKARRAGSSPPRILAAVDPAGDDEDLDRRIVRIARRLTDAVGGELHLLHAFDVTPVIAAEAMGAAQTSVPATQMDLIEAARERHRSGFERLLRAESLEGAAAHLLPGDPVDVLVSCTEELGIDFVVMGIATHDTLKRLFVGHTAERVVDRLPADLIVVKPDGFESAGPAEAGATSGA